MCGLLTPNNDDINKIMNIKLTDSKKNTQQVFSENIGDNLNQLKNSSQVSKMQSQNKLQK